MIFHAPAEKLCGRGTDAVRDRTRSRVLPDQEAVLSEIPATHLHCQAAFYVFFFIKPSFLIIASRLSNMA